MAPVAERKPPGQPGIALYFSAKTTKKTPTQMPSGHGKKRARFFGWLTLKGHPSQKKEKRPSIFRLLPAKPQHLGPVACRLQRLAQALGADHAAEAVRAAGAVPHSEFSASFRGKKIAASRNPKRLRIGHGIHFLGCCG